MRVGDKRRLTIPPQMVRCLQCAGWSGRCSMCHAAGLPDDAASVCNTLCQREST